MPLLRHSRCASSQGFSEISAYQARLIQAQKDLAKATTARRLRQD